MSRSLLCLASLLLKIIFIATVQGINSSEVTLTEISKCCPLDQKLSMTGKECVETNLTFNIVIYGKDPPPADMGLTLGLKCNHGRYHLEPYADSDDEFQLISNGSLYVPRISKMLSQSEYCMDMVVTPSNEVMAVPFLCFSPVPAEFSWKEMAMKMYSAGCMISIIFLLMTLLVYICTPNLRGELNGKVLICHIACLTVAYTSLSTVLLIGSDLPSTVCVLVAFCIQFSFLASFFWLNVLCFNTWRKLRRQSDPGEIRRSRLITSNKRSKRFMYYNMYAWGVPCLFVVITLGMDMSPSVPSAYLKPNFGLETCWFKEDATALSYFYAPIAIILLLNLIIFIMSAFSVNKNTKATPQRLTSLRQVAIAKIRQRRKTVFVECLILFLIMGFNWAFEVVSWAVGGPPQLWFFTDLYNTLQGIIVFYVFVYREAQAWQAFVAFMHCKTPQDSHFDIHANPLHSNGYAAAPTARH